jgi:two-component system, OmpR family, alkaline phosphatase synthesis response regulator PhoP
VNQARKTILIMDDSDILLELAKHALETAGFRVFAARNLGELESHGDAASFDLILMDMQMPEAFGDDVATVLRHARNVTAPIYLFSSLPEAELDQRAREAGLDGFISKSAGLDALVERVRLILDRPPPAA